jgi:hypothetical protein
MLQAVSMLAHFVEFSPQELAELEPEPSSVSDPFYPGGWSAEDGDWLLESFGELRDFFGAAADRGSAVLTCIV